MRYAVLIGGVAFWAACAEPPLPPPPVWVSAPLQTETFTLERFPIGVENCEDARATWTPDHGRLLAGPAGLVSLDADQTRHSSDPVSDLLSLPNGGVLLATPAGFKVYDNDLAESPLEAVLAGAGITRLRQGPEALWMVGGSGLHRWHEEQLERIADRPGLEVDLWGPHQVLIHPAAGAPLLIDRSQPGLATAEIPFPGGSDRITPGPGGRLHARHRDGWWLSLDPFGDEDAWHRLALGNGAADTEAELWALARDSVGDGLWAVTAQQIVYLSETETTVMATPESFLSTMRADVDAYGSLWLFCAEPGKVLRIGGPVDAEVTWSGRIAAFNSANCQRCHDGAGGARDLSGIEQWRDEIDLIVDAVVSQRMPQDGRPLVGGSAALLTAWKEGGMLE